jgi:hypothetical protein
MSRMSGKYPPLSSAAVPTRLRLSRYPNLFKNIQLRRYTKAVKKKSWAQFSRTTGKNQLTSLFIISPNLQVTFQDNIQSIIWPHRSAQAPNWSVTFQNNIQSIIWPHRSAKPPNWSVTF